VVIENEILIPKFADYLRESKEVLFTPSGVSMRPFIEGGKDSVILQPVTDEPRVGDVILAEVQTPYKGKTFVLHRLIRIEQGADGKVYVLQGDGNLSGEEVCKRENIIGRVTAVMMPSGRHKCLTKGRLWHRLLPVRKWLLKIYRHTLLKMYK